MKGSEMQGWERKKGGKTAGGRRKLQVLVPVQGYKKKGPGEF